MQRHAVARVPDGTRRLVRLHGGRKPLQRVTLFLFSIPIALLVNIIRINSLCIVGTATSVETATGFFHDASGYVLFGLGFVLLMGAKRLLRC